MSDDKNEVVNQTENMQQVFQKEEKSVEAKTFSEDYVKALREENKAFRVNAKNYETKLKEVLELSSDTDLSNVDNLIKSHKESTKKQIEGVLKLANDKLIQSEIKSLNNYNTKLVEKLLDKTKISIDDEGNIQGLNEELEKLELEFPEIKKSTINTTPPPNPVGGTKTEIEQLESAYEEAQKQGNLALLISIKNKIFSMRQN